MISLMLWQRWIWNLRAGPLCSLLKGNPSVLEVIFKECSRKTSAGSTKKHSDCLPLGNRLLRQFRALRLEAASDSRLLLIFRVASPDARFVANCTKIGIHPGFALTYTLPRLIGPQRASLMFYSGKRVKPDEALSWRLVDVTTSPEELRAEARRLAQEIAVNAPLAVVATRATLRQGMVEAVRSQLNCELEEQNRLFRSDDFREGVRAVNERRPVRFIGR
jgi:hypothetical protein